MTRKRGLHCRERYKNFCRHLGGNDKEWHPDIVLLAWLTGVLLTVFVHEMGHAIVAFILGIPMTWLNPISSQIQVANGTPGIDLVQIAGTSALLLATPVLGLILFLHRNSDGATFPFLFVVFGIMLIGAVGSVLTGYWM